jgi:anti-sigma factor RsiW
MTRDELEQRMADYLAGEMPPDQRAEFEGQAAGDPALARELAGLQQVQSLVASLQVPATPPRTARATGTRRMVTRFAAAAAILLAFLAGFGVRGMNAVPHDQPQASADPAEASRQAVIRALEATPSHSELAQSLVALAALKGN